MPGFDVHLPALLLPQPSISCETEGLEKEMDAEANNDSFEEEETAERRECVRFSYSFAWDYVKKETRWMGAPRFGNWRKIYPGGDGRQLWLRRYRGGPHLSPPRTPHHVDFALKAAWTAVACARGC